jgi:hypothetical protein
MPSGCCETLLVLLSNNLSRRLATESQRHREIESKALYADLITYYLLLITYCLLLTAYCLLLTAYCLLLTTYYSFVSL